MKTIRNKMMKLQWIFFSFLWATWSNLFSFVSWTDCVYIILLVFSHVVLWWLYSFCWDYTLRLFLSGRPKENEIVRDQLEKAIQLIWDCRIPSPRVTKNSYRSHIHMYNHVPMYVNTLFIGMDIVFTHLLFVLTVCCNWCCGRVWPSIDTGSFHLSRAYIYQNWEDLTPWKRYKPSFLHSIQITILHFPTFSTRICKTVSIPFQDVTRNLQPFLYMWLDEQNIRYFIYNFEERLSKLSFL